MKRSSCDDRSAPGDSADGSSNSRVVALGDWACITGLTARRRSASADLGIAISQLPQKGSDGRNHGTPFALAKKEIPMKRAAAQSFAPHVHGEYNLLQRSCLAVNPWSISLCGRSPSQRLIHWLCLLALRREAQRVVRVEIREIFAANPATLLQFRAGEARPLTPRPQTISASDRRRERRPGLPAFRRTNPPAAPSTD